jgi:hypothetical protein
VTPNLFEDKLTSRAFGIVSYGVYKYKLDWKSIKIDPVFKRLNAETGSLSIDQILYYSN